MTQAIERSSIKTSSDFSTQIDEIIATRKETAKKIATTKENFQVLLESLTSLNNRRDRLVARLQDKTNSAKLRSIDIESSIKQLQQQEIEFKKLYSRFGRDTLNIAVVGMAGQGKSRLLQTLTGLSKDIIPDGKHGDCTAVRSNIHHRLELGNAINIKVKFHDEESFLKEVIVPYYKDLNFDPIPKSIDELLTGNLPKLSSELSGKKVAIDKYEHLQKYYDNLPNYLSTIKGAIEEKELKNVDRATIKQYVTQDDIDDTTNFDYLAVREVDIFCSFPNLDVGKITFVDMPGLGDNKINNAENLLQALGQDIDFVLFMRMPVPIYRKTSSLDSTLYDLVNKAIPNLPIKEWSFYVVNRCSTPELDNTAVCKDFRSTVIDKDLVIDAAIADCSNLEETTANVLTPVLEYLTQNVQKLDKKYGSACQEKFRAIQKTITEKLDTLSVRSRESTASNFGYLESLYTDLFNDFYHDLGAELNELSKNISERGSQNNNFKTIIEEKIIRWIKKEFLPDIDRINTALIDSGRHQYQGAIIELFKELQVEIANPFQDVDKSLQDSLIAAKSEIAGALVKHKVFAKMNIDNPRFFNDLLDKIEAIPELEVDNLKAAIAFLQEYNVSYQAKITNIIKKSSKTHLKYIPSVWETIPGITKNKIKNNPEKYILETLRENCQKVISESQAEIKKLSLDPPKEFASMVKQFVDKAFRDPRVKDDWRKFLSYHIEEIWSDEFGFNAKDAKLEQEWMQVVDKAKQANNIDGLSFL